MNSSQSPPTLPVNTMAPNPTQTNLLPKISELSVSKEFPSSSEPSTDNQDDENNDDDDYEDEYNDDNKNTDVNLDGLPSLWTQDGWSLTWPIWHLLPLDERKKLAIQHGYKTIGEFEEYMSLHRAMDDSEAKKPYANESLYWSEQKQSTAASGNNEAVVDSKLPALAKNDKGKEETEEDEDVESDLDRRLESSAAVEDLSFEDLLKLGGKILMLHDEILHQIFAWLPVDTYAVLARVSPHWKHLTRTEAVYKRLCERLYLNQSKRRQLHVGRFGGSYRTMLEQRPRVRAAGGCYVLKYSQVKRIQRDMWTEVSGTACF